MPFTPRTLARAASLRQDGNVKELNALLIKEGMIRLKSYQAVRRRHKKYIEQKRKEAVAENRRLARHSKEAEQRERQRLRELRVQEDIKRKIEAKEREATLHALLVKLIKDKKITVTAKLMKATRDPVRKRELIEATCLSRV